MAKRDSFTLSKKDVKNKELISFLQACKEQRECALNGEQPTVHE